MCYQWVRRGRKVTCDNPDARSLVTSFNECDGFAKSRHGIVPWMCRDVVGRYHSWSDCSVYHYSFDTLPAAGKRLVGTPTPARNSMPRQRLRSIPLDSNRSDFALAVGASRKARYKLLRRRLHPELSQSLSFSRERWGCRPVLSLMPKLVEINKTIQEPLGRYAAVVAIPNLFSVETVK